MDFRAILRTAFSGKDNESIDLGRVLWASAFVLFDLLELHSVIWLHATFEPMSFAQASGLMLAGGGMALAAKAHCEPDPIKPTQ